MLSLVLFWMNKKSLDFFLDKKSLDLQHVFQAYPYLPSILSPITDISVPVRDKALMAISSTLSIW